MANNLIELISNVGESQKEYSNLAISSTDLILSFIHSISQKFYIIDFSDCCIKYFDALNVKRNILYIARDEVDLFIRKKIYKEELHSIIQIDKSFIAFANKIDLINKRSIVLYTDFHIVKGNGFVLVSRTLTPLSFYRNGNIKSVLCTLSYSANKSAGLPLIKINNTHTYYKYRNNEWHVQSLPKVNGMEIQILILSMRGFTVQEISEKLYRSEATIKTYKRRLFKKFSVSNISEAISFAINYKLI
ncbi:LuxR C-terminal-related transcriptional regulator [Prevotella denticola]|uniref:response regulator transcription factor n=1 Tax=Prevotella denticola TaxID=28129 RepID=UPI0028EAD2AA|nr:LuxR C-terminal-related transcriptional regulator [Prevotella denticola]